MAATTNLWFAIIEGGQHLQTFENPHILQSRAHPEIGTESGWFSRPEKQSWNSFETNIFPGERAEAPEAIAPHCAVPFTVFKHMLSKARHDSCRN